MSAGHVVPFDSPRGFKPGYSFLEADIFQFCEGAYFQLHQLPCTIIGANPLTITMESNGLEEKLSESLCNSYVGFA